MFYSTKSCKLKANSLTILFTEEKERKSLHDEKKRTSLARANLKGLSHG